MKRISRAQLLAATAAGLAVAPRIARSQTPPTIRVAGVPTDDLTPIFYAIETGMYAKAGLNVSFVATSSGGAATTAVVAGSYEIAKSSPLPPVLARVKGLPVEIIANGILVLPNKPFSAMVVAADGPIRTGADCNGKIGVSPGLSDINSLAMMTWMDKNGGDSRTVKWVEVPGSAAGDAIVAGRVDFALIQEPQLSAALETGKLRVLSDPYASVSTHCITSVYLVKTDFGSTNVDALRRFVRVTYASAAFTNTHKADTVALMSEETKIPPVVYSKMKRGDGSTSTDPSSLQPIIDMAVHYKVLDHTVAAKEFYWPEGV